MSKKSDVSLSSNNDESAIETTECEEVQLRTKPVHVGERSSVNQCINELSSNLAAEAARRRCNSEIVHRTDNNRETDGKFHEKTCLIIEICMLQLTYVCVYSKTLIIGFLIQILKESLCILTRN